MTTPDILICLFLLIGAIYSVAGKKLTIPAAITGGIIGLLAYKGGGYAGLGMLTLFFILGSAATGWKKEKKQKAGIVKPNESIRTIGQVLANGGMVALLGMINWLHPDNGLPILLMMAGSMASATADTLSSELGSVYGRRFYDILSLKHSPPGPDGVVSLEGTLIGAAGAASIAFVYVCGNSFSSDIFLIIIAGIIGNLADSLLGATFERRGVIGNNLVNFLNTATGALMLLLWRWH